MGHQDNDHQTPVLDAIYHTSWSWLRVIYPLFFLAYWFNRFPKLEWVQAVVYGVCFVFFFWFAPLATSMRDDGYNDLCVRPPNTDELAEGDPGWKAGPIKWPFGMEMACLFLLQTTFVFHGLLSGCWNDVLRGRRFRDLVSIAMLLCFAAILISNMMISVGHNVRGRWSWICNHLLLGFLTITIAEGYVLLKMNRQLLSLIVQVDSPRCDDQLP